MTAREKHPALFELTENIRLFNEDDLRRQRLRKTLRDEAEKFYRNKPDELLDGFARAVAHSAGITCDAANELQDRPELRAQIRDYLRKSGFKGYQFMGCGVQALVLGDHEKVARITSLGAKISELVTPEILQPYSTRSFHTDMPDAMHATDMTVEILPRLLPLERLVEEGLIRRDDAAMIAFSVAGSIHRKHPECFVDDSWKNIGVLPDGTPIMFDRNVTCPLDEDNVWLSKPWKEITVDHEWTNANGMWKQKHFFPNVITPGDWRAGLDSRQRVAGAHDKLRSYNIYYGK